MLSHPPEDKPGPIFPSAREGFWERDTYNQPGEGAEARWGIEDITPLYPGVLSLSPSSICAWERSPDETVLFPESETPKWHWTGSPHVSDNHRPGGRWGEGEIAVQAAPPRSPSPERLSPAARVRESAGSRAGKRRRRPACRCCCPRGKGGCSDRTQSTEAALDTL